MESLRYSRNLTSDYDPVQPFPLSRNGSYAVSRGPEVASDLEFIRGDLEAEQIGRTIFLAQRE